MNNYININNQYFEILIPSKLKKYGQEVLKYSTDKVKEYLTFFGEKNYGEKIKVSFFIQRTDFIERIKEISPLNSTLPPEWATGCFYGGEIQILLNEEKIYDKFCTVAHETFHLFFKKFIYEKYNYDRIMWLDESLAGNFDGTTEKLIRENKFLDMIKKLIHNDNLPLMSELSFRKGNINRDAYNGYDLFKVVGRYLVETKTNLELLAYIKQNKKVLKDGDVILENSLLYFKKKYNL